MELWEWRAWWKLRGESELRALLLYAWDPIGVAGIPQAADQYEAYAARLGRKLYEGATAEEVAAYLDSVESELMEFDPAHRNAAVGQRVVYWYENSTGSWLRDGPPSASGAPPD
jgi:hypothetical protein